LGFSGRVVTWLFIQTVVFVVAGVTAYQSMALPYLDQRPIIARHQAILFLDASDDPRRKNSFALAVGRVWITPQPWEVYSQRENRRPLLIALDLSLLFALALTVLLCLGQRAQLAVPLGFE
jgi:hypothetical protein